MLCGTRKGDADAKGSDENEGNKEKSKTSKKKSLQALVRDILEVFPTTSLAVGILYPSSTSLDGP